MLSLALLLSAFPLTLARSFYEQNVSNSDILIQWTVDNDGTIAFAATASVSGFVGLGFSSVSHVTLVISSSSWKPLTSAITSTERRYGWIPCSDRFYRLWWFRFH